MVERQMYGYSFRNDFDRKRMKIEKKNRIHRFVDSFIRNHQPKSWEFHWEEKDKKIGVKSTYSLLKKNGGTLVNSIEIIPKKNALASDFLPILSKAKKTLVKISRKIELNVESNSDKASMLYSIRLDRIGGISEISYILRALDRNTLSIIGDIMRMD